VNAAGLAAALGHARREGRDWRCLCPAHDDHDPSLAITERDGKLLLTCRAGCDQEAVIAVLCQRGLWPDANGRAAGSDRRIVATYSYRDPGGSLRYQVVRYAPKDFRQRRPNGAPDAWIWKMEGTEPLPYRLPELLEDAEATVYVCEGEKDCDNLGELGLVATTNHGGAGKWRDEISRWLAGRNVCILADNDTVGRDHGADVARKLAGIAASVRILELPELPPKGDVSDWLAAGGTADELERLATAQEGQRSGGDVIDAGDDDAPISPRGWLQGTTFCRGFISALTGAGAAGKTAIRYLQYLAQATGQPFAGEPVHARCPVLIICLEDGIDEVRRRIRALRLRYSISTEELKGWLFYWAPGGHKLMETDPRGQRVLGELEGELRDLIHRHNLGLVGIDPFIKAHGCDENDNNAVDAVCIVLSQIAVELDCGVDLLQHHRKGALSPGDADSGRGASALKDAARLVRTATPMTEDEAETFGINPDERASLVRLDDAKINLAPRAAAARWFKLVGVALGNGTAAYPHGDTVQAAEPWAPPELWSGVSTATFNAILDEIDAGLPGGRLFYHQGHATDRAAWPIVVKHIDRTEAQAREIIRTWVKNGVFVIADYVDQADRKTRKGLRVNPVKRPG
jgi:AAA domain